MPPRTPLCEERNWNDDVSFHSTFDVHTYSKNGDGSSKLLTPISSPQSVLVVGPRTVRPLPKSLRFAAEDEILLIRHIDDFSDEEISNIWFDQSQYADIKSEYKEVIFAIECGRHIENDDETSRGLENRTQEGSWARFQIKRDSYNAVLDEQDRQWKEDADDDEMISKIYRQHSLKCARKAYQMGLIDEIAARKIYAESSVTSQQSRTKRTQLSRNVSMSSNTSKQQVRVSQGI